MKTNKFYGLLAVLFCVGLSCREVLISSADETKEQQLVGDWVYQNPDPMDPGTVQLSFQSDLTVHVFNTLQDPPVNENYHYHVEDGILFLNRETPTGEKIEFYYAIVNLTVTTLVLEFFDSGHTRQSYGRL